MYFLPSNQWNFVLHLLTLLYSDFYFLVENSWPFCQLCFLAEEIIFITQRELSGYTKKYENSPCKEFNSLGVYLWGASVRNLETDMFSWISWEPVRLYSVVQSSAWCRPHRYGVYSSQIKWAREPGQTSKRHDASYLSSFKFIHCFDQGGSRFWKRNFTWEQQGDMHLVIGLEIQSLSKTTNTSYIT